MSDHDTTRIETRPAPQAGPHDGGAATRRERRGERFLDDLQRLLRAGWIAAARLVRQGNRRRVTLRSREGEVWVRMPLTLTLLVVVLLTPAWPLLLVLVAVGFAVGAQLSVERLAQASGEAGPRTSDGAA
ncbi:MAG: DUF4342 domain-containing protein [Trueperaceae bacterium]|nr:MAG: DUF4342 domain-containing protein [Trueperaceae bacterium]